MVELFILGEMLIIFAQYLCEPDLNNTKKSGHKARLSLELFLFFQAYNKILHRFFFTLC